MIISGRYIIKGIDELKEELNKEEIDEDVFIKEEEFKEGFF
jgi:hypothetical protein